MAKWYVVVTKANAEAKACAELTECGIEHFLPVMKITHFDRRKRTRTTITKALFSRYLFVRVDDFYKVHDCDSVIAILGVRGAPVAVADADVEQWRSAVECGTFDRKALSGKDIRKGQQVLINGGALNGFAGQVISAEGKKMVRVMAQLLGGLVQVSVSRDSLTAVA